MRTLTKLSTDTASRSGWLRRSDYFNDCAVSHLDFTRREKCENLVSLGNRDHVLSVKRVKNLIVILIDEANPSIPRGRIIKRVCVHRFGCRGSYDSKFFHVRMLRPSGVLATLFEPIVFVVEQSVDCGLMPFTNRACLRRPFNFRRDQEQTSLTRASTKPLRIRGLNLVISKRNILR